MSQKIPQNENEKEKEDKEYMDNFLEQMFNAEESDRLIKQVQFNAHEWKRTIKR